MKKTAFLLASFLSTVAMAQNDSTLAELAYTGGFRPAPALPERVIIRRNGDVVQFTGTRLVAPLAKLSLLKTQELTRVIDALPMGPLRLQDPDGPICMDAPREGVSVVKSNGTRYEIFARMDCRDYTMPNSDYRVGAIVRILEGFSSLTGLRPSLP